MHSWDSAEWKEFIAEIWSGMREEFVASKPGFQFDEDMLTTVTEILPRQPWPQGVHKDIAEKLDIKPALASRYIQELIKRGFFKDQTDGQVANEAEG